MTHQSYWENKNVLITGGTSGLGRALTMQINELGSNVGMIARTKEKISEIEMMHPNVIGIQGDVSKKQEIYPLAGEVHSRLGDIDILFNVASYLGDTPLRNLIDTDCEDLEKVLQTNVLGPFRLSKAILPAMLLRKKGLIVNISSDAAISVYPTWGSYSISKASIDHMSKIFDIELKAQGVRFLSIDPGDMNTPMHFAAIPDANPAELRDPNDSAAKIIELIVSEDRSEVRRSV